MLGASSTSQPTNPTMDSSDHLSVVLIWGFRLRSERAPDGDLAQGQAGSI